MTKKEIVALLETLEDNCSYLAEMYERESNEQEKRYYTGKAMAFYCAKCIVEDDNFAKAQAEIFSNSAKKD